MSIFPEYGYFEEVKGYITSERGNNIMVDQNGFHYILHRKNDGLGKMYWKCRITGSKSHARCYARAQTVHNKIVNFVGKHNHPPNDSAI